MLPRELIVDFINFFESLSVFDQFALSILVLPIGVGLGHFVWKVYKACTNGIPHIERSNAEMVVELTGMRADFKDYYTYVRGVEDGKKMAVDQVRRYLAEEGRATGTAVERVRTDLREA
jgi:hypothetical protein